MATPEVGLGDYIRPEPMDPNDRLRQKTQSRADVYPYDKPVSYGAPRHTGMGGDERQVQPSDGPPLPRQHKAARPGTVWDRISDGLDRFEAPATPLGDGNFGQMGEDGVDAVELEIDALKIDFRTSYDDARPTTDNMGSPDLFRLLTRLDPDFAAETFAPEDEEEMRDVYGLWADRMSGHEE